jgi:hypothetical protein
MTAKKEPIILPSEDRIRMTRLYEEVLTRVEEMALITARTLRLDAGAGFTVKFNPVSESEDGGFVPVEIVRAPQGHGCYDYREGACFLANARRVDLSQEQGGLQ